MMSIGTSDYQTIIYDVADGILTITLNRPDQLNAFTTQMANELEARLPPRQQRRHRRRGGRHRRGRAFCAGMDLSIGGNVFGLDETQRPTSTTCRRDSTTRRSSTGVRDAGGRVTLAIFDCTKPVIAAINGAAVGIGATMTLAMDVRLASENARIGFVFGKLGIVPEACSTWFLPRIVGISKALEWVYRADILRPAEAQDAGLVKAIYPPEELLDEAYALARSFTTNRSAVATALTRQMMYRNSAQPHPIDAHRIDSLAMFYTSASADGHEGVDAFLEKRAGPLHRAGVDRTAALLPLALAGRGRLQRGEELDQRVVDLRRSLLLQPVTGAGQDLHAAQPRHRLRQGGDGFGRVPGDQVVLPARYSAG